MRGMPVTILGDKLNQNIALKTKIYLKYGNIYIKGDTLKKNHKILQNLHIFVMGK
jgi:hypothetical protein